MIRLAENTDISNLLRMGEKFHIVSGYEKLGTYDIETTKDMFEKLIKNKTLLTDGKNGMIGFVVFPLFFNNNILTSQELFWWVDEGFRHTKLGVNLLVNAEKQAKILGANSLIMLSIDSLNGKRMSKLYESLGYIKTEQTFMRSL